MAKLVAESDLEPSDVAAGQDKNVTTPMPRVTPRDRGCAHNKKRGYPPEKAGDQVRGRTCTSG